MGAKRKQCAALRRAISQKTVSYFHRKQSDYYQIKQRPAATGRQMKQRNGQ